MPACSRGCPPAAGVLNKRVHGIPVGAVYVGRPSKWGNPFSMRSEQDRDSVCDAYERWLERVFQQDPAARDRLKAQLRGKDLVCWCAPRRCHADTLLRIANED